MKIVFITSTLSSGGSERVMSLLANTLSERGHDVEIICLNQHIVFYPITDKVRIWFAEDEAHSDFIGKKMIWFRNKIKRETPNIVIAFMLEVYCVTLASLLGLNTPVISSERIDPHFFGRIKSFMRWILLRRTTHLVVQTQRIKGYYSKKIQDKTTIIQNPVTNKVFEVSPIHKQDRIIAVGRLAYQKNYPMMLRAFKNILQYYPQYQLVIFGEGPQRQIIENYIDKLRLNMNVKLLGRSDNITEEMNKSKLFIMSSDYEGMSNALLEAVCMGLPVISTDVSGAKDLIDDGINGFITPIRDDKAFTNALLKMLSDESKMTEMGNLNKKKAENFKENHIVDIWEELIIKYGTEYK